MKVNVVQCVNLACISAQMEKSFEPDLSLWKLVKRQSNADGSGDAD